MNLKRLVSKDTINSLSRLNGRLSTPYFNNHQNLASIVAPVLPYTWSPEGHGFTLLQNPRIPKPLLSFTRYIHSTRETKLISSSVDPGNDMEEEDEGINEFLSRFVWTMRKKMVEAYLDCDKQTIDGMLLILVEKVVSEMEKGGLQHMLGSAGATPSQDFSEDLWKTVWEVSNSVLEDMEKARKKEKMKGFLQSEEVKVMTRFAGEIGIRGDLLKELRFKWAREKMEECEFYEGLERMRKEAQAQEKEEAERKNGAVMDGEGVGMEDKPKVVTLPKRHGKIKYKIYGLDLSDSKWTKVADKIHESEEVLWPQEPKPVSGKCKLVTEKILSLKEEEDPSLLLAEWKELLQPSRIDWITLLDKLQEKNTQLCFKVSELLLSEKSFQTNVRDYSKLIEAYAKENRLEDAERIFKQMNENGILPDILTATVLVHMYSKAGNLDRAKEAFERLKSHGFQPDMKVYNSMIMAYVNVGQPKLGEMLIREMEVRDIKPSKEIYLALLRSFARCGDVSGAGRIAITMQFAGFQPTLESCTLLVEAYGLAGDPDQARSNFDDMIKLGYKPDDRCTASMIAAYEKKNLLDKALSLLLQLEKDGFEPGPATYTVLVDWLGRLQLVDEAEHLLGKISELGEAPPFKLQVSLCDMYARARVEKKALQALGVLESREEQMEPVDFERVINGLIAGGFVQDALRVHRRMEGRGYTASEDLKVALMASEAFSRKRPTMR
ncbi:pentatricopeptide repeat-containing protein At5g39710 [Mangifera indica]|uniref:pentatricopeptide repeat-containing protein At5g39710 n=1 Tax=Mangifera indica TaxID=29780 RepID=UPI001CFC45BC|nr:pentatricopeptide repeat-containing protein At5g39710 [Mangifera indica]